MLWLYDFGRDLRHSTRVLRRAPAFSLTAIVSLGLGIALTAATVAVVNAYLIRSLPYPASSRLYNVQYVPPGERQPEGTEAVDWTALEDVVEVALASDPDVLYLTEGGYTERAPSSKVTAGFLEGMGIRPALGRTLTDDDAREGAERVALISHALWRNRFAEDPNVIGRPFRAYSAEDEQATATLTIVGVLPAGFWTSRPVDVLLPMRAGVVPTYAVRLRDGVSVARAEQRITAATQRAASSFPAGWDGVRLRSVHEQYAAGARPVLVAVTAAAGLVLLIVLINVAVLMLLRATRRQKEVALRMALGAGRSNLTRMLVADACVLTATAVMVGLTLTTLTLGALAPLIEQNVGRSVPGGASMVAVDRMVLLVIGGLGVLIAGTLSLVPLLSSWRSDLFSMLRRDSPGGTGSLTGTRVRSLLTAAEISGAVALLVGCGLMVRTVMHLTRTDLGFNTDGIVRASFSLPGQPYLDPVARLAFYERLLGVLDPSASVSDWPPFVAPPLHPIEADAVDTANLRVAVLGVGGSYFQTLGVRVTEGRGFAPGDRLGSAPVAVVSASLARRLWPEGSAVGRRIHTTEEISFQAPLASWRTVVGVAADVRQTFVDNDLNDVYLPFLQVPNRFASLYLRTDAPLPLWIGQVREAVAAINPEIAVGAAPSLASAAEQLLAGPRFLTSLLSGFAVFTMLIAILGIHGVVTYSVQQREREIAIRIALGATRGGVTALLVRHGAAVLGLGILVGLAGASLVTRLLQTQLQGVGAFDAVTLMLASALLGAAGLLASWWPARRAARRDPLASLKAD